MPYRQPNLHGCNHVMQAHWKKKREKKRENIRSKVVDELDDRQEKGINVKISLLTTGKEVVVPQFYIVVLVPF